MSSKKMLWKNIDWKNRQEKTDFFNKYFLNDETTKEIIEKTKKDLKQELLLFIRNNKIKIQDKERTLTIQDIIQKIEGV